jgi:hypothetical protein
LGVLIQEGVTNTAGSAPGIALATCERVAPVSGNTISFQEAEVIGGPLLGSPPPGVTFSGAGTVIVLNGAPSSTEAVAADSSATTGGLAVLAPPKEFDQGQILVDGGNVANNVRGFLRGGALNLTLSGPIATGTQTGGKPGPVTFTNGSVSCGLAASSSALEQQGVNLLVSSAE